MSEAQLVARFGFSKAAIRAALARLRAERLVLAEPRRGHVIAPLTIRDVGEIYDLRLLLEPPAAAAAAGRIAPDELAHLRARSEPALDLDDPASVDRFMEANRAVHVASPRRAATAGPPSSSRGCSTTASARAWSPCAPGPAGAACERATSTARCSPPWRRATARRPPG